MVDINTAISFPGIAVSTIQDYLNKLQKDTKSSFSNGEITIDTNNAGYAIFNAEGKTSYTLEELPALKAKKENTYETESKSLEKTMGEALTVFQNLEDEKISSDDAKTNLENLLSNQGMTFEEISGKYSDTLADKEAVTILEQVTKHPEVLKLWNNNLPGDKFEYDDLVALEKLDGDEQTSIEDFNKANETIASAEQAVAEKNAAKKESYVDELNSYSQNFEDGDVTINANGVGYDIFNAEGKDSYTLEELTALKAKKENDYNAKISNVNDEASYKDALADKEAITILEKVLNNPEVLKLWDNNLPGDKFEYSDLVALAGMDNQEKISSEDFDKAKEKDAAQKQAYLEELNDYSKDFETGDNTINKSEVGFKIFNPTGNSQVNYDIDTLKTFKDTKQADYDAQITSLQNNALSDKAAYEKALADKKVLTILEEVIKHPEVLKLWNNNLPGDKFETNDLDNLAKVDDNEQISINDFGESPAVSTDSEPQTPMQTAEQDTSEKSWFQKFLDLF